MPEPTSAQKNRFLRKVYFAVSDNPNDDVNPYDSLEEFGNATVGSMRWGQSDEVRKRSKLRFSYNYHKVLEHYKVLLSIENVFSELNDEKVNNDAIKVWASKADFL
jgi:hypothetical protein